MKPAAAFCAALGFGASCRLLPLDSYPNSGSSAAQPAVAKLAKNKILSPTSPWASVPLLPGPQQAAAPRQMLPGTLIRCRGRPMPHAGVPHGPC